MKDCNTTASEVLCAATSQLLKCLHVVTLGGATHGKEERSKWLCAEHVINIAAIAEHVNLVPASISIHFCSTGMTSLGMHGTRVAMLSTLVTS